MNFLSHGIEVIVGSENFTSDRHFKLKVPTIWLWLTLYIYRCESSQVAGTPKLPWLINEWVLGMALN